MFKAIRYLVEIDNQLVQLLESEMYEEIENEDAKQILELILSEEKYQEMASYLQEDK